MVNKRKRDDLSDSDSDEITPGKQTLPVANLPRDFDQEPQDGLQYLFLVRRDARRLPHITRVRNPYEVSEAKAVHPFTPSSTNILPREEWRSAFQTHFSNLKGNLTQATIHIDHDHSGPRRRVIPEKKDRDAWWKFLAGHPESAWNPRARSVRRKLNTGCRMRAADPPEAVLLGDTTRLPAVQSRDESRRLDLPQHVARQPSSLALFRRADSTNVAPSAVDLLKSSSSEAQEEHIEQLSPPEVTPSYLKEIDHRMSIHLLMYFTHWINVHLQNPSDPLTAISVSHGQWVFGLLAKIEDQLSADEMNLLRNLARASLGLISRHVSSPGNTTRGSWWMVFAAVAGHWGQRDLWADAEATLAGLST